MNIEFSKMPSKKRGLHYQLTDPFTRFHFDVIESRKVHKWTDYVGTPSHSVWAGYAFELVCLLHVRQIKRALGIENVVSEDYSWRSAADTAPGAQVDLVIDRKDDLVELCEMKYCQGEFNIDAAYANRLRNKVEAFRAEHPALRKAVHVVMVTPGGVAHNAHYRETVKKGPPFFTFGPMDDGRHIGFEQIPRATGGPYDNGDRFLSH